MVSGKIQNSDKTIIDLPKHVQKYYNTQVKVVHIPISELKRNYDNKQLKISYKFAFNQNQNKYIISIPHQAI